MDKEDVMAIHAVLCEIADALKKIEKAIREPHYDTNDGAIRVSVSQ
jgi:hypothetical protein